MKTWFSRLSAVAFLLIGLFALAHSPQKVYACTPTSSTNPGPPPIQYSIEDRVSRAPLVLEGTVISTGPGNTATIEVHRYFKGNGPAIMTGVHYGDGAMCQAPLFIGGPVIIFVGEWQADELAAFYLGEYATVPVTEENIQQIVAITGQEPIFPDVTLTPSPVPDAPTSDSSERDDFSGLLQLCLAGFLPMFMGIVVVKRRANL
ncbi:MAG: hypothetical protein HY862_04355 [Chloroflexi bacterium]|nr:hypothetical protein [Chloroflexota bacterium]